MAEPTMIVTGASGGVGSATALLAAQRGYGICVHDHRNRAAADELVNAIARENGRATAVQADISVEDDVVRLFDSAARTLGPVAALVNNAATLERQMRVDEMDAARLHSIFNTNVIGTILCAREAVRSMSTRHGGTGGAIVNVSSGGGGPRLSRRVCRLRRQQRRRRHPYGRTCQGGCRRGHSCQRGPPRLHLHRSPCKRWRARPSRARQIARPDAARRPA